MVQFFCRFERAIYTRRKELSGPDIYETFEVKKGEIETIFEFLNSPIRDHHIKKINLLNRGSNPDKE